ncbi:hypothetical protein [Arthrobacter sp. ISL-28]|nr:hypothetical protein [Arthrobacter sp. ISL-28]
MVRAEFDCALIDHPRGHGYPAPPVQRILDSAIHLDRSAQDL